MGGEELEEPTEEAANEGLPPRGRGRELVGSTDKLVKGITPAWAGKSQCQSQSWRKFRDYPRVGGEE